MNQSVFQTKFQKWQTSFGTGDDPVYEKGSRWTNIGNSSLDKKFTELAELFLAANPEQRELIRDYFEGQSDLLWKLITYERRVAMLITTVEDSNWLRLGLAIASIENGRLDFRDSIVSLVILRYAAKRVGINPSSYFNDIIKISPREGIFINARDHSSWGVRGIVNAFGPEEWHKPWWKFWG